MTDRALLFPHLGLVVSTGDPRRKLIADAGMAFEAELSNLCPL